MSNDEKESGETAFLSRWSRLKREEREKPGGVEKATPPAHDAPAAPPVLPPVESLTIDADFSGFLHPRVDDVVRKAALKKLFSDPHFNVMDGLDVYIDDYSKPDPLPAAMLAGLRQAQNILAWAKETKEETAARFVTAPGDAATTPAGDASLPAEAIQTVPVVRKITKMSTETSTDISTEVSSAAGEPANDKL